MLVDAVVVDEDGGSTNVGIIADGGVTDIRQVRHLCAAADLRLLCLDEAAQLAFFTHDDAGADVGKRADLRVAANDRVKAVRAHHMCAFTNLHVGQGGVGADLGAIGDGRGTPQLGVGVNGDILANGHVDADPGGVGINDGSAAAHGVLDHAAVEQATGRGQLHAVVHSGELLRISSNVRADAVAVFAGNLQNIGDVELALGVIGVELRQSVTKHGTVEREDAGVDLAHLSLFLRGVLLFHDGGDGSILGAQHAAVTGGILQRHGQNCYGIALAGVSLLQLAQSLRAQKWNVTVSHDDGSVKVR